MKNCLYCDNPFEATLKRKFCNSTCRQRYYRALSRMIEEEINPIEKALQQNRRILRKLSGRSHNPVNVHKNELLEAGFHFNYVTDTELTAQGQFCFCYDYGYILQKDGTYMLIRAKKGKNQRDSKI